MKFTLIVTVGPSILNRDRIREINSLGDCIFRINGAHADSSIASGLIQEIREFVPGAKIMLDLPGNKVRTANLEVPIQLNAGESFLLKSENINFKDFYKLLRTGDQILANDSIFQLLVEEIQGTSVLLKSLSNGVLVSNKGLHVQGISKKLPFLFQRDYDLIKLAVDSYVDFLSLSFVRNAADICEVKRNLTLNDKHRLRLIAKVETRSAVENLGEILLEVDAINVDRGDLSSDIGLHVLPRTQDRIIESGLRSGRQVFLATQFLKSMEKNPVPYIAELVDLHKTVKSGISGIQLSEETAVGCYPVECVKLVFDTFKYSFDI